MSEEASVARQLPGTDNIIDITVTEADKVACSRCRYIRATI